MELARGTIADRPWGATLAALHRRTHTGTLMLTASGSSSPHVLGLRDGALVGATSPTLADSALKIAATIDLVPLSAIQAIATRILGARGRDEVDVIAETVKLEADQVHALRVAIAMRRAVRTFTIDGGDLAITDDPPIAGGCALDLRAVIFQGALTRMSDARLDAELAAFGTRFELRDPMDLAPFEFGAACPPELLASLGTCLGLPELDARFVDLGARTIRAVVYALLSCGVCAATDPPRARANTLRVPVARMPTEDRFASGTLPPRTFTPPRTITPRELAQARTSTPRGTEPPSSREEAATAAFEAGLRAIEAADAMQAVMHLTRAAGLAPARLDIAAALAWATFSASSDREVAARDARRILGVIVSRETTPKVARFYLGRIERTLGHDREALAHYREVLSAQPGHPGALAEVHALETKLKMR